MSPRCADARSMRGKGCFKVWCRTAWTVRSRSREPCSVARDKRGSRTRHRRERSRALESEQLYVIVAGKGRCIVSSGIVYSLCIAEERDAGQSQKSTSTLSRDTSRFRLPDVLLAVGQGTMAGAVANGCTYRLL